MALLVDETSNDLISNLWTQPHHRLADDPPDVQSCYYWQAVPSSIAELSEWLQIVPNPATHDRSRPYTVTHVPDADEGTEEGVQLYEVGVRIQGYLERFNMASTGNWDGKEHSAVKAVQSIVLSGGDDAKAWAATLTALNRIASVVTRLVQPGASGERLYDPTALRTIYLQRRVFPNEESTFHVPNDAAHRGPELHAIRAAWHLDQPIEFGTVNSDGSFKRGTSLLFRPGNFVDVTAHVEVVVNRNGRVRVQFRPERVVLLGEKDTVKPQLATRTIRILKRPAPTTTASSDGEADRGAKKRAKLSLAASATSPQPPSNFADPPSDLDIVPLGLPPSSFVHSPSVYPGGLDDTAWKAAPTVATAAASYDVVRPVHDGNDDLDDEYDSIPGDLPGLFGDHDIFADDAHAFFAGNNVEPIHAEKFDGDEDSVMQEAE